MKAILMLVMVLGIYKFAKANDVNDDYLLPIKYDSFYVHPAVSDTIVFTEEYGGTTRFIAMTASAKAYVASLQPDTAYSCTFSGRSVPCLGDNNSLRGCNVINNKIQFTSANCIAKK